MSTFFQIIGIAVVSIIVLLILAYYGLKLYLRIKLGKRLAKALEHGQLAQPARLHLESIAAQDIDDSEFHELVNQCQQLDFNTIGYYLIPEIDNTTIYAASNNSKDITIVIYSHIVGCFFDVVATSTDKLNVTYSTAPAGDGLDHPPGEEKHYLPAETTLAEALRLLEQRTSGIRTTLPRDFVSFFEDAYAKEMDWRLDRGMTAEEVKNMATKQGAHYSDEQIQAAIEQQNYQYSIELDTLVIDTFLDSGQVTAKQWNNYQDGTLIIHKKSSLEDLQETLAWYVDELETRNMLTPIIDKAENCWQLMDELNPLLPSSHRFELIGSLDSPVSAKLFYNRHY